MARMSEVKGIAAGLTFVILMHGVFCVIMWLMGAIFPTVGYNLLGAFLFLGLTQLIYIFPVVLILRKQRKFAMMKGVIIAAVITALLNGGCWLWASTIKW